MKIIDTHGDALYKMQLVEEGKTDQEDSLDFRHSPELDTNLNRLKEGNIKVQFFAMGVRPEIPFDLKWQNVLEQIDLFYTRILGSNQTMKHIKRWEEIDDLKDGEIGAVLALEGADPFGNDLMKLRQLYRLGIMSMNITWNNANLCADGCEEPRGGGLTLLGEEVVKMNNEQLVFTDVSHATVQGFWDIIEHADYPIASHSNVRALCDHPRNLYDDQITAMFDANGFVHVAFFPPFINKDSQHATIADLIKHIDHLCSLGGVNQVGFGSDFDGVIYHVKDLENSSQYHHLINELLKFYTEDQVKGFAYQNFLNNRPHLKTVKQ